jgi:uncharacterized repeat protein (TIGR02543 family)
MAAATSSLGLVKYAVMAWLSNVGFVRFATSILLLPTFLIFTHPISASAAVATPGFGIYIDQPFVQGSYASGDGVQTESFDSATVDQVTFTNNLNNCAAYSSQIGTIIGGCSILGGESMSGGPYSASTTNSAPEVGDQVTNFLTNYNGAGSESYGFMFSSPQKYIGFWWASGSVGNTINFWKNGSGTPVAILDVNQVNSIIGLAPTEAAYPGDSNKVNALDGSTQYSTKRYFGNPRAYDSLTQNVKPTVNNELPNEPFVYVHAFAKDGAFFDQVTFEGPGFEVDNITTSSRPVPIRDSLIEVQTISASIPAGDLIFAANYDSSGGSLVPADTFTSGSSINLPSSPIRNGYSFAGWFESSTGGSALASPYTPADANDLTLYAQWNWVKRYTSTSVTIDSNNLNGDESINETETVRLSANVIDTLTNSSIPDGFGTIDFAWVNETGTFLAITGCTGLVPSSGAASCVFDIRGLGQPINIFAAFIPTVSTFFYLSSGDTGARAISYKATYFAGLGQFTDSSVSKETVYRPKNFNILTLAPSPPSRANFVFIGWQETSSASTSPLTTYLIRENTILRALWSEVSAPPNPPNNDAGASSNSSLKIPGITWNPKNLSLGDALGADQLSALFSVPGKIEYDFKQGFRPEIGELILTVTFTPENSSEYMVLSTSRVIQVLPIPKASPTPVAQPSQSSKPQTEPVTVTELSLKKIGVIYFRNNEYFLDAKDRAALKELSSMIKSQRFKTVIIQGNTDVKKGVDNYWLSRARAEAVSNYLGGLAPSPLYNRVWYASKRPVAIGLDKNSLALNRRVEIYVQVKTQKEVTSSPAPGFNLAKSYQPIAFNRNESFLDADDRSSLLASVKDMAGLGCNRVYLKGSRDQSSSSVNSYIVTNRVGAVKNFMIGINPSLKFIIEPGFISANREVRIRCTN